MADEREEKVRKRAYGIWEKEGRPSGREREHWDRAAREVDEENGAAAKPRRASAKPAPDAGAGEKKKRARKS